MGHGSGVAVTQGEVNRQNPSQHAKGSAMSDAPAYGPWSLVIDGLDLLSHDAGHLWQTLLGWKGDPHLVSAVFIGEGVVVLARDWAALHGWAPRPA